MVLLQQHRPCIRSCTRDNALANGKPLAATNAPTPNPPASADLDGPWPAPLRVQRSESLKEQEDGQVETPWWMYGPQVGPLCG